METDAGAVCGVLVLSGPPCSGKSTVGRVLASGASSSRPQRLHIEVDSLFDLLLPRSDRNRDDRMLAYDSAHLLARMFLERGTTAVLECTYARIEQRLSLVDALAGVPAAPLWVVECFVSPEEAVRRFRRRSGQRRSRLWRYGPVAPSAGRGDSGNGLDSASPWGTRVPRDSN